MIAAENGVNELDRVLMCSNRGSRVHIKDEIEAQFGVPVDDLFKDAEIVVRRDRVNLFSGSGHLATRV